MLNEKTAIKIEFRIPGFYWSDGIIVTDGNEFYGSLSDDLIIGTINHFDGTTDFTIYFNFPCEDDIYSDYVDAYNFHLPTVIRLPSANNVQGLNDEKDIIIGVLSINEIYSNSSIISSIEDFVVNEKRRLGIWWKHKYSGKASQFVEMWSFFLFYT